MARKGFGRFRKVSAEETPAITQVETKEPAEEKAPEKTPGVRLVESRPLGESTPAWGRYGLDREYGGSWWDRDDSLGGYDEEDEETPGEDGLKKEDGDYGYLSGKATKKKSRGWGSRSYYGKSYWEDKRSSYGGYSTGGWVNNIYSRYDFGWARGGGDSTVALLKGLLMAEKITAVMCSRPVSLHWRPQKDKYGYGVFKRAAKSADKDYLFLDPSLLNGEDSEGKKIEGSSEDRLSAFQGMVVQFAGHLNYTPLGWADEFKSHASSISGKSKKRLLGAFANWVEEAYIAQQIKKDFPGFVFYLDKVNEMLFPHSIEKLLRGLTDDESEWNKAIKRFFARCTLYLSEVLSQPLPKGVEALLEEKDKQAVEKAVAFTQEATQESDYKKRIALAVEAQNAFAEGMKYLDEEALQRALPDLYGEKLAIEEKEMESSMLGKLLNATEIKELDIEARDSSAGGAGNSENKSMVLYKTGSKVLKPEDVGDFSKERDEDIIIARGDFPDLGSGSRNAFPPSEWNRAKQGAENSYGPLAAKFKFRDMPEEVYHYGQRIGLIDEDAIVYGKAAEEPYFHRDTIDIPKIDLSILVDSSGSMSGSDDQAAAAALAVVKAIGHLASVRLRVYVFSSDLGYGSGYNTVLCKLYDNGESDINDPENLKGLVARQQNADGTAIHALCYELQSTVIMGAAPAVLMISDGQPAAGSYNGIEHTAGAVKRILGMGVNFCHLQIGGTPERTLNTLYGNRWERMTDMKHITEKVSALVERWISVPD